ncbi:24143_t:CDS:2, partial [Gigaspora margarita]
TELTETVPSRKFMLELLECGTTNYVQNDKDTMEVSFSPCNNPVEGSENETNSKEENIYSSIWVFKSEETLEKERILSYYQKFI